MTSIHEKDSRSEDDRDAMLTIGVFDGVHRGHQHLIRRLVDEAAGTRRQSGVITFRNHPDSVLHPGFKPQYVTSLDDRIRLIRGLGVDFVSPITFDAPLSRRSAREFVTCLQREHRMRGLVVGPDFAMGHRREGDVRTLAVLGKELGFSLDVVDGLVDQNGPVRSTTIRKTLVQGDVSRVASLLGRNYSLAGPVVRGAGRGSTLGFPTANLAEPVGMAIPCDGIYAAWAHIGNTRSMAAISIGTRPTFDETGRLIEAFLLDFEGDLYGQELRLEFVQHLRDQEKFDTVEALQDQIDRDVEQTTAVLRAAPPDTG